MPKPDRSRLAIAIQQDGRSKSAIALSSGIRNRQVLTNILAGRGGGRYVPALAKVLHVDQRWLTHGENPPKWIKRFLRIERKNLARSRDVAQEQAARTQRDIADLRALARGNSILSATSPAALVERLSAILDQPVSSRVDDDGRLHLSTNCCELVVDTKWHEICKSVMVARPVTAEKPEGT